MALTTLRGQLAADRFIGPLTGTVTHPVRSVSGTVTVATTDAILIADAAAATVTVNLPAAADSLGRMLVVKKIDSSGNYVVLDGNGSETIDDETTQSITTQYTSLSIACDGAEWWII